MTYIRKEVIGAATLYLGDCVTVLENLKGKVNAVVTSPPYDDIRDYGSHAPVNCFTVINCISQILLSGGVCVWNVSDQTKDGSETGTSFRHALHAKECGLRLHDTMIVCKEGVTSFNSNRYHPAFEYVFIFSKGAPAHFNGIKDWKNKTADRLLSGGSRRKDGTIKPISTIGKKIPSEGLRRNWWITSNPYIGETEGHPAPMSNKLAADQIITWTDQSEIVLDPFMGSGTTGIACAKIGRNFVGIEIHEPYFDIACRRIEQAQRQSDMFIRQPEAAA